METGFRIQKEATETAEEYHAPPPLPAVPLLPPPAQRAEKPGASEGSKPAVKPLPALALRGRPAVPVKPGRLGPFK